MSGSIDKEMTLSYRIDAEGGESVRVSKESRDPATMRWTNVTPLRGDGSVTLVRAEISRGKRHQIRAHLAAAGFPVVGDRRYAAVPPAGTGKGRLMLHAAEVAFLHPGTREWMTVRSPLPEDFDVI